jgi:Cu(I)/Ag(I) efflux system membrane protein CusA/SilA
VTYPLTTTMLSVPGAKAVRGFSFFGDSFVYVLFEDGTDLYWARSRVLEYLNQVQSRLPAGGEIRARAGCHRRGLDLRIRAGRPHRPQRPVAVARAAGLVPEVRAEDGLPDVAEVATVGGMNRQYQVVLDPLKLAASRRHAHCQVSRGR